MTARETPATAVIGSPSTTTRVTLNVLRRAYRTAIYGQMVVFAVDVTPEGAETRTELALGTVTEVETVNPVHRPNAVEAQHVAETGRVTGSGDDGDTRSVTVSIESVFRRAPGDAPQAPGERVWLPAGAALSNSPATGTKVRLLDQRQVDDLMAGVPDQRWLGTIRATSTLVPYTTSDFGGARGARHSAVIGATGSGKTAATSYAMACDLFHDRMGQIIFDPQGQWATEHGMVFSLQGLAAALGRKVTVARLSRSLRLRKDAPMFTELLARTGLFTEIAFGAGADAQIANACRVFEDALDDKKALSAACGTADWTEASPGDLLAYLLGDLRDALPTGTVYAGADGQQRVAYAIAKPTVEELEEAGQDPSLAGRYRDGVLDQRAGDGKRWRKALARFAPIHNLWSPFTPEGAAAVAAGTAPDDVDPDQRRVKAWPLLMEVFTPRDDRPAPWLILDLSGDEEMPGLGVDEETDDVFAESARVLDDTGVKARIMRQLVGDLGRAGLAAFKAGEPLNTRVTFDEAWAYAMTPEPTTDRAVAALSDMLEDGCRDMRKIGVGLRFILQAPSGLREGIWKQLTERMVGYGVTEQSDLRRLANVVGDDHLRLYLSTAGPDATGRYPFMFVGGGVTGLSFGNKPVFLDMFTDPTAWLTANQRWVSAARARWMHLLPSGDAGGRLDVMPRRPAGDAVHEARVHSKGLRSASANRAAAAALVGAARSRPGGGFGMGAPASTGTGGPVSEDPPPPF